MLLLYYTLVVAAAFGILEPGPRLITIIVTALVALFWGFSHWRGGWKWYHTPLDLALLLWGAAFVISIISNPATWRQSATGLWFMGLYFGLWVILSDALANGGIKRVMLVESVLFGGLAVVLLGYYQVFMFATTGRGIPRVVSTMGNPNIFGTFLIVLALLALGLLGSIRNAAGRISLGIYVALVVILCVITGSRGALLGLGAGIVVWAVLMFLHKGLLSRDRLRALWGSLSRPRRTLTMVGITAVILTFLALVVVLVASLDDPGRGVDLRTYIYSSALQLFLEKPLSGNGLFTFGYHLPRFGSMPPLTPHSHAHNAALHVAAELGLPGLIALTVTLAIIVIMIRRNWALLTGADRTLLAGIVAAAVGFATHHLLDMTMMFPVIALIGLVTLALAISPVTPVPISARWRLVGLPLGLVVLWPTLVAAGLWSTGHFNHFTTVLRSVLDTRQYRLAAEQLEPVITADPQMSLQRGQQALLFGIAAGQGDDRAHSAAITAYETVVDLEPNYAPYWANLAALYWADGRREEGFAAMQKAADLAPMSWQLQYGFAMYAEALGGRDELARSAYRQALVAEPNADFHPDWGQTALQQEIQGDFEARPLLGKLVALMDSGSPREAFELWRDNLLKVRTVPSLVLRSVVALELNDLAPGIAWFEDARPLEESEADQVWLHMGAARIARFEKDDALAEEQLALARAALTRDFLDADYARAGSLSYALFLSHALPVQFVPQVYYPVTDPLLLHLIATT